MNSIDFCPNTECQAEVNWAMEHCPVCNCDLGVPTKRFVNRKDEVSALASRYRDALDRARHRSCINNLNEFEQRLINDSKAVINCKIYFLFGFISDRNKLYSNYRLQTASVTRKVAEIHNDRQRCATEGVLFGALAPHIDYAALTISDQGLVSYGPCAIFLKEIVMKNKATVLEENSFSFVRKHKILPGDDIPLGFWTDWKDRHLLGIAKLADKISTETINFSEILINSDGNRQNDDFIEVHVYGGFDYQAIEKLALPQERVQLQEEWVLLRGIVSYASSQNIPCIFYD